MRIQRSDSRVKIWASARDTESWATRPGKSWPCSTLRGRRFFAEFSNGDLVDLTVNGRYGADVAAHELNAFIEDFLGSVNPL